MKRLKKNSAHHSAFTGVCIVSVWLAFCLVSSDSQAIKQLMFTSNEKACNQKHYYETDNEYLVRANGEMTDSRCELSFLELPWSEDNIAAPCISLCIRITNYSLRSCDFAMIYNDGLGDLNPKKFDCHTFPPLLWCSVKNDIKIEFVELEKYNGEGYDITLEVKPICGAGITEAPSHIPGESYKDRYYREEKKQRDTVIITGSLVSTVSFLFVIFWIVYCCWKRKNDDGESQRTTTGARKSTAAKSSSTASTSNTTRKVPWFPMHEMPTQGCGPPSSGSGPPGYTDHQYDARYTELPTTSNPESKIMTAPYHNRQSPGKDVRYRDEQIAQPFVSGSTAYDADVELSFVNQPSNNYIPPLPPRPLINPNSKQYFI